MNLESSNAFPTSSFGWRSFSIQVKTHSSPSLQYERSDNSSKKKEILKEITETLKHRSHLDNSVDFIGKLLLGAAKGPSILAAVRPSGLAMVDDWNCLKVMVMEDH